MTAKPCRCDHCTGAWGGGDTCDCGHPLAGHSRPFHSCSWCLWCDEFQTRRPMRAKEETQ